MGKRDGQDTRTSGVNTWRAGCGDKSHVRFGGRAGETHRSKDGRALRSDPYVRHEAPLNLAVMKGHRHMLVAAGVLKLRAA